MNLLDLTSVALRSLAFLASLQAAGLWWFFSSCNRSGVPPAPALVRFGRISALLGLSLVLLHRLLDAGRMGGEWGSVLDPVLQSMVWSRRPGVSSIVCTIGLGALLIAFGQSSRWNKCLGYTGALAVLCSFAVVGHTTEATHAAWLQCLVTLHVGIASYWLGAVAGLLKLAHVSPQEVTATAALRFSTTAVWLVPLLLPAGALLVWGLLPDLQALRTTYGAFLAIKLAGFCVLIALAAGNRMSRLPALATGTPGALAAFQRTLRAEYAVLVLVLAATATMTSLFSWN